MRFRREGFDDDEFNDDATEFDEKTLRVWTGVPRARRYWPKTRRV
jgi:hypothetical protein